ncbi:MAG: ATP-dependent DNA helicase PcrA [Candidatus Ryanbacteria bacterium CG10_big_fil_rev_8_21_14_0_10_43_42]|uniref:DNA 3'-5' helicase n=1 Tax=Candidatus Ryanbacteria bacterium CG10_big_fil_rev_8_21_14_0_10_43_42 TaxID=1974864 RepID=A0A2M8KW83_9BACT|nr:MAG: ATP-dependent DNA helicase PcrA [Candidatus Ryanbacteria bacterium CG10_big_fil_rev_8_21_14_0_10_43_42]
MSQTNILNDLNPAQQKAVLTKDGALLVIAGAGSGKTKVLVHRIARLIETGVRPENILAVTFTNKAAREMKERAIQLLTGNARSGETPTPKTTPWIGTFHALGVYILRRHGSHLGIPGNFTILDEDEARALVKRLLKERSADPKQFPPARIRQMISHMKNNPATKHDEEEEHTYPEIIRDVFRAYEEELERAHTLDFDDLLVRTLRLLSEYPDVLAAYHRTWPYIMVDEYQDTNHIQYTITKLLSKGSGNIMVVGDIDQAIYSWRGANFRNILAFEKDWPKTTVITLEQNYRSTSIILEAANTLIKNNNERREKNLWTANEGGDRIRITVTDDERQEARYVLRTIHALTQKHTRLNDIAILYRTNAQSRAIEEELIKHAVPYRLVGGTRFYERKEIRDMLAYMRIAQNPEDVISMDRIRNVPARGIGKVLAEKYKNNIPLTPKEQKKISIFENIRRILEEARAKKPVSEFLQTIIRHTAYESFLRDGTAEGEDRWANILELFTVTKEYDSVPAPRGTEQFLEEASLLADADTVDETTGAVHLMTVHAAKGLEFNTVFVVGLEEGVFPHSLSAFSGDELEEERRLCYVALTRAKSQLFLTMARTRMLYGEKTWNEPSRFLAEIPEHLITETPSKPAIQEEDIIGYDIG